MRMILVAALAIVPLLARDSAPAKRLNGATGVISEILQTPDRGSVGFQIGGSETDVVMLIMNQSGEDKLLESKFTLGGEGSVAAGPVGRTATAQTDAQMHAEILSWSRSQGLFAGISLQGATLRQDLDDNATVYGKKLENRAIMNGAVHHLPKAAARLIALLDKYSSHERGPSTASIQ